MKVAHGCASVIALFLLGTVVVSCITARNDHAPSMRRFVFGGREFVLNNSGILMFPMSYKDDDERERSAAVPKVRAFSICGVLPELESRADQMSHKDCFGLGLLPSRAVILAVQDRGALDVPRPGLSGVLKWRLQLPGANPGITPPKLVYASAPDEFGLHRHNPVQPELYWDATTVFWSGPDVDHVRTFIECRNHLKDQKVVLGLCNHRFFFPPDTFPGRLVSVTLYYRIEWLREWNELERRAQHAITSLIAH